LRILLTGCSGQVGWELARALPALGEVIATDRKALDLADSRAIRSTVRAVKPDVIVNAGAYTAVDRAESEPDLAAKVNAQAPSVLAHEAKRLDALLVHFSTDYVFDGSQRRPYTELDEPKPLNVYGKTKLDGDNAVTGSGCRHLVLRTSWVYGPRGRNFFLTILRKAGTGETLRVVDDQIGAPTSSLAIANAVPSAISRAVGDPSLDGIYHLSAGESTTWCGFACAIVEASGMRVPVHAITSGEFAAAARRPRNSLLNNAKIARQLGIRLPSWRTGMAEVLAALGPGLTAIKN
jgi:dTDP-4-dehydrorhamnose reductase